MFMKIAIWGMGVSGLSALKYLKTKTDHDVVAINQGKLESWSSKDEVLTYINHDQCFDQDEAADLANEIELIIISPGISPKISALKPFKHIKKICEVEFAAQRLSQPIIAITGTNGKTTTATMIAKALEASGKSVFLGGNIGVPLCELLLSEENVDIIVLELSSFQLELMDEFRANMAIILNITPSHMERYSDPLEYKNAKLNIVMNQQATDLYLAPDDLQYVKTKAIKKVFKPIEGHDFSNSKLVGEHNKLNFSVVEHVLKFCEIQNYPAVIQNLINTFAGVKYRLEFVRTFKQVDFYNDAKSTNPAATIAAVKAFTGKKIILILGGKLRSHEKDIFKELRTHTCIKQVYAIGESRLDINRSLGKYLKVIEIERLEDVIDDIKFEYTSAVLFSPGFPSFDQYQNYMARGEAFEKLVQALL